MAVVADGFEELQKGCAPQYDYPLPQDHLRVFHDVARCWIGKTERFGRTSYHINWMIDDRSKREINYRLTFDSDEALRSNLYQGYVATREPYRRANHIKREELNVEDRPTGRWRSEEQKSDIHSQLLTTSDEFYSKN